MKRLLVPLAAAATALLLVSCASLQRSADQGIVRRVADFINAGDAKSLASLSATPFLVDGEVVPLADDVGAFWQGIVKAGFKVDGATLDNGAPVAGDTFLMFSRAAEVKFWFSRYTKNARIIVLTASGGRHIFLIARSEWFTWKLLGWKGPF